MTCNELRLYLEENGPVGGAKVTAEHLEGCAECRRIVGAHEEVARQLHIARKATPPVPVSLDSAVLTAYRGFVQQGSAATSTSLPRKRVNTAAIWLAWAAATAAVLAVVMLLVREPRAAHPILRATQSVPDISPRPVRPQNPSAGTVSGPNLAVTKPRPHFVSHRARLKPTPAASSNSLPAGFQSLMYCDPLSCLGTMEIIRVQVSASDVTRAGAVEQANGSVLADVLVGPDGIARAIRFVN